MERPPEVDQTKLKLVKQIGRGGFGVVTLHDYLTFQDGKQITKQVAVKKLIDGFVEENDRELLKNEAKLLWNLKCEHIINMVGLLCSDGGFCVVMEYAIHGSCSNFFRHLRDFSKTPQGRRNVWPLKCRIVYEVIEGMKYLHGKSPQRILHLDLKAQNVLLDDKLHAKICDFGLSQMQVLTGLSNATSIYQRVEKVGGTPTHCAPERLKHPDQKPSVKLDTYSFGIFIWELVANDFPYKGTLNRFVIDKIIYDDLRPKMSDVPRDTPNFLVKMMRQSWAGIPEQRPSFSQLRAGFQEDFNTILPQSERSARIVLGEEDPLVTTSSMLNDINVEISPASRIHDLPFHSPQRHQHDDSAYNSMPTRSSTTRISQPYVVARNTSRPNALACVSHNTNTSGLPHSYTNPATCAASRSAQGTTSSRFYFSIASAGSKLRNRGTNCMQCFCTKRGCCILFVALALLGLIFLILFLANNRSFCFISGECGNTDSRCPRLNNITNGIKTCFSSEDQFIAGDVCEFDCRHGYVLTGSSTLTCSIEGTWTGDTPTCTIGAATCLVPSIVNGRLVCNGFDLSEVKNGTVCTVRCDVGYELNGVPDKTCLSNGDWSASNSECIRVCPVEALPENLNELNCTSEYFAGSICSYRCYTGHTIIGFSERSCQANGNWNVLLPTCECAPCRYGPTCGQSLRYSYLSSQLSRLDDDKTPIELTYGDRTITCESDVDIWFINYDCTCSDSIDNWDGTCNDYLNRREACRHAVANLLRHHVANGLYEAPCDIGSVPSEC